MILWHVHQDCCLQTIDINKSSLRGCIVIHSYLYEKIHKNAQQCNKQSTQSRIILLKRRARTVSAPTLSLKLWNNSTGHEKAQYIATYQVHRRVMPWTVSSRAAHVTLRNTLCWQWADEHWRSLYSVEAGNVVEGEPIVAEVGHIGDPHVVGARYEHEETEQDQRPRPVRVLSGQTYSTSHTKQTDKHTAHNTPNRRTNIRHITHQTDAEPPVRNFDWGARRFPRGDCLSPMQLIFILSRKTSLLTLWIKLQFF